MNLIIVESPTKARTISAFLKEDFIVRSSFGHVRDLPKNELGVDIENNFQPKYVIPKRARKRISDLKRYLPKSEKVILATDEDREGEAIAWHLVQILNLNGKKPYQRITFHEITKKALEEAIKNPREIDMNRVNAQIARRVLDRLVGYKLSPLLWEKVRRGLSAGRVQSVAVKLVCKREREIREFRQEEYWTIEALLQKLKGVKNKFLAKLYKKDDKVIPKLGIENKGKADEIVKDLQGAEFKVKDIEKKEKIQNPLPPFTTSILQQEAWRKFYFPAKFTMRIAQNLYERGVITYHRTDSFNLSDQSLFQAKKVINEKFGKEYWAGYLRRYKIKSKLAQEAHEAIRPTFPKREVKDLKEKLKKEEEKLYDLIWRRFIASQMAAAKIEETKVQIEAKNYIFESEGRIIKFDGFLKVYPLALKERFLPPLEKNEVLRLSKLIPSQHFTIPPPRYSEATLIKTLERYGIGRPSTYAPILSTIQKRNYVKKDGKRKLYPTEIGDIVNNLLVCHFPEIVDIKFTAKMEENLDKIAKGKIEWTEPISKFHFPFEEKLKKKRKEIKKEKFMERTDEICPKCGKPLLIKIGKYGKFYACSNFPKCHFTKPYFKSIGIPCPKCKKGEVRELKSKSGKIFYGCSRFPECDWKSFKKPKKNDL